jgi:D-alanyl-D-alanine carboxypeptidase (penicillin-binding protein 5/6)
MNLKRAVTGSILSLVFLAFFTYLIFGVQIFFENAVKDPSQNKFLGSLTDNPVVSANFDKAIVEQDIKNTNGLDINAQSAISVQTNLSSGNQIIFSKNIQRKLPIASITKLMTALVVTENLDLSKEITISETAASQSKYPETLKAGEEFYAKDLLYAMLIGSDNTSAYALSESIGTDKFVGLMNAKAKEVGLLDTSFADPTGISIDNFSTTQDLEKLAEHILKNKLAIFQITITPEFDLKSIDGKILYKITNTDKLLNESPDFAKRIVGSKTGDTRSAGQCMLLVVKTSDNKSYLISVILNSNDRFGETRKIIDFADAQKLQ